MFITFIPAFSFHWWFSYKLDWILARAVSRLGRYFRVLPRNILKVLSEAVSVNFFTPITRLLLRGYWHELSCHPASTPDILVRAPCIYLLLVFWRQFFRRGFMRFAACAWRRQRRLGSWDLLQLVMVTTLQNQIQYYSWGRVTLNIVPRKPVIIWLNHAVWGHGVWTLVFGGIALLALTGWLYFQQTLFCLQRHVLPEKVENFARRYLRQDMHIPKPRFSYWCQYNVGGGLGSTLRATLYGMCVCVRVWVHVSMQSTWITALAGLLVRPASWVPSWKHPWYISGEWLSTTD